MRMHDGGDGGGGKASVVTKVVVVVGKQQPAQRHSHEFSIREALLRAHFACN